MRERERETRNKENFSVFFWVVFVFFFSIIVASVLARQCHTIQSIEKFLFLFLTAGREREREKFNEKTKMTSNRMTVKLRESR